MRAFRELGRFLTTMDAKAATSLFVSTALLLFVLLIFVYGRHWLGVDGESEINFLLSGVRRSAWSVPIVVGLFIVLALVGFPQYALIAATVLAFGARHGALYSWLATMISATVTFGLGRLYGSGLVRRFGGERAQSTIDFIGRHGIVASGLIRVVPTAPFIVVNAAAGAAHIPLWKYWAGTSIGIVPKIVFVAVLYRLAPGDRTLAHGLEGLAAAIARWTPADWALLIGVIAAWLGLLLGVRAIYESMRRRDAEEQ